LLLLLLLLLRPVFSRCCGCCCYIASSLPPRVYSSRLWFVNSTFNRTLTIDSKANLCQLRPYHLQIVHPVHELNPRCTQLMNHIMTIMALVLGQMMSGRRLGHHTQLTLGMSLSVGQNSGCLRTSETMCGFFLCHMMQMFLVLMIMWQRLGTISYRAWWQGMIQIFSQSFLNPPTHVCSRESWFKTSIQGSHLHSKTSQVFSWINCLHIFCLVVKLLIEVGSLLMMTCKCIIDDCNGLFYSYGNLWVAPIVLVGYSFGGLVVKSLMVEVHQRIHQKSKNPLEQKVNESCKSIQNILKG
jgi:hypothetical protein